MKHECRVIRGVDIYHAGASAIGDCCRLYI